MGRSGVITEKMSEKRNSTCPLWNLRSLGDVNDWLTFWGQFKMIDENPKMDDADKF